jgi:hypothetical protein
MLAVIFLFVFGGVKFNVSRKTATEKMEENFLT